MKTPTAGIILAAGESRRFGGPKQLLRLGGRFLVEWVLEAALRSNLDRIVLVLGCGHDRIRRRLGALTGHPKCAVLVNPDYPGGMSTSLRAGVARIEADCRSAMFLLGDQPLVDAAMIDLLLERFAASEKTICAPTHRGARGNPTLFGRRFYPAILNLTGDQGARRLIDGHPDQVLAVEVPDPAVFLDIDRREDVAAVAARLDLRRSTGKGP